jgi:site-specific DNA-methyltransferase (adenine-specific)
MSTKVNLFRSDALELCKKLPDDSIDLIYTDPPYNTGKEQGLQSSANSYVDKYENYKEFLYPILVEFERIAKSHATVAVHLDHREVHYAKIWMDEIFGRDKFQGEIIWKSEIGGIRKNYWAMKHTTILLYCKGTPRFNSEHVPRLKKVDGVSEKRLVSVWDYSLVPTAIERIGYPNQKPERIVENFVLANTNENDWCLDPFAGSGTLGRVAHDNKRNVILGDLNTQSINTIRNSRLPITKFKDLTRR